MKKTCIAFLGVLLLALHLSSEVVRAQTTMPPSKNMTMTMTMGVPMTSTVSTNSTIMPSTDKNGCGSTDAFTLLLPLALAASLLHDWS